MSGERWPRWGGSWTRVCVAWLTLSGAMASAQVGAIGGSGAVKRLADYDSLWRLTEHRSPVLSVAYSADGRWLASADEAREVRLWEAPTGRLVRTLPAMTGPVHTVALNRDATLLAVGGGDRVVRVWRVNQEPFGQELEGHVGAVYAVVFSPDGRFIASGGADGTVRLWDVGSGALVRAFLGHEGAVLAVAFSPDGRLLVTGGVDRTARLWDVDSGALQQTLRGHRFGVYAVAFSPDGRLLASGSADRTIRLWTTATGMIESMLEGHTDFVRAVGFTADGRWLVSGGDDGQVRLWSVSTGLVDRILSGHGGSVLAVAVSPDGGLVVSASADRTLLVWGTERARILARRPELGLGLAPQDEFESDAVYRRRLSEAERALQQAILDRRRELAAEAAALDLQRREEARQQLVEREARIAMSRRIVRLDEPIVLERYDANAERYPMRIGDLQVILAMPSEEARSLSENRARIMVEAVEQLDPTLTKVERFNRRLVHPVSGRRYPIGPQRAIIEGRVTWDRVMAALRSGLQISAVQRLLQGKCVEGAPTVAEATELGALLRTAGLSASEQSAFIAGWRCRD